MAPIKPRTAKSHATLEIASVASTSCMKSILAVPIITGMVEKRWHREKLNSHTLSTLLVS